MKYKLLHPQPGIQYIAKLGITKHALCLSFILAACFSACIVQSLLILQTKNSSFFPSLASYFSSYSSYVINSHVCIVSYTQQKAIITCCQFVVLCDTIDTTIDIDTKFGIAKESIGITSIGYILLARLSCLKNRATL